MDLSLDLLFGRFFHAKTYKLNYGFFAEYLVAKGIDRNLGNH